MKGIFLILLPLIAAASAGAQRPFSRDYWLNENSTPVKVNALAKDRNGYLWMGTDDGLYRFNGRSFLQIADTSSTPITAVAADGDRIFCGYTNGRIRYLEDGSMHVLAGTGKRPSSLITSLSVYSGCLYACTDEEGIFAFVNGRSFQLDKQRGLSDNYVYALAQAGKNQLLAATDHGINILSIGPKGRIAIRIMDAQNNLPDNIVRTIVQTPLAPHVIWAGMQDGGLSRVSGKWDSEKKAAQGFDTYRSLTLGNWHWGQINDVLPVSEKQALIATEDGYLVDCRIKDTGFETRPVSFPGKRLRKLIQDGSGTLWCATTTGVTLITDNYISWLPVEPPYALSGITAMACDKKNDIYYSQGRGIYKSSPHYPGTPEKIFMTPRPVTSLHFDGRDQLWAGTLGAGLWCIKNKQAGMIRNVPHLINGQILSVASLPAQLWVSSLNGVEQIIFKNDSSNAIDKIIHHGKHEGLGSDYVYQLFPDSKGNMWVATDGAGICMYDGRQYHHWDSAAGFPAKVVYSITEDSSHQIWAATFGGGLYVYGNKTWHHVGRRQGLKDIAVSAIAGNASGQVIAVHGKGIDEWYPGSQQFRHFNPRLGVDIDSQSNALNCYTKDTAGNVWVPFEHGLICFHNIPGKYDLRPRVVINDVLLFFRHVSQPRSSFAASENHIGVAFDGINFTNPERLVYRYKLEGYDSSWVSTIDESVTFPRLPAGQYRFRVQASLSSDFEGANEAEYSFSIALPFWKQKWALAIFLVFALVAAYLIVRLRERNLRKASRLQRERMMAEYEQLKSQVNPHFLFNSLNTLASLIDEDSGAAVNYTMQLSDLYRSILTYKDRDLIYLSDEWALLKKYIYIQQTRFQDCLHIHSNIPESIAKTKQIIPLALQLLIENAIKHNIVSQAQPLHIYIDADEDSIVIKNRIQPKMSAAEGERLGLANISRRYSLMTNRAVSYGTVDQDFIVTIPLL